MKKLVIILCASFGFFSCQVKDIRDMKKKDSDEANGASAGGTVENSTPISDTPTSSADEVPWPSASGNLKGQIFKSAMTLKTGKIIKIINESSSTIEIHLYDTEGTSYETCGDSMSPKNKSYATLYFSLKPNSNTDIDWASFSLISELSDNQNESYPDGGEFSTITSKVNHTGGDRGTFDFTVKSKNIDLDGKNLSLYYCEYKMSADEPL